MGITLQLLSVWLFFDSDAEVVSLSRLPFHAINDAVGLSWLSCRLPCPSGAELCNLLVLPRNNIFCLLHTKRQLIDCVKQFLRYILRRRPCLDSP